MSVPSLQSKARVSATSLSAYYLAFRWRSGEWYSSNQLGVEASEIC